MSLSGGFVWVLGFREVALKIENDMASMISILSYPQTGTYHALHSSFKAPELLQDLTVAACWLAFHLRGSRRCFPKNPKP